VIDPWDEAGASEAAATKPAAAVPIS